MSQKANWFEIQNQDGEMPEILIFGPVVNADLIDEIKDLGDFILRIDSLGGSTAAGIEIYNTIKRHAGYVTGIVEGLAASSASVILMACDTIIMPSNAMMLIHKPWGCLTGNADAMRECADRLDKGEACMVAAYRGKTGMDAAKIEKLMAAETLLTAEEALNLGFADKIEQPSLVAACIDFRSFTKFKNKEVS